jgi:hypothetical protein
MYAHVVSMLCTTPRERVTQNTPEQVWSRARKKLTEVQISDNKNKNVVLALTNNELIVNFAKYTMGVRKGKGP